MKGVIVPVIISTVFSVLLLFSTSEALHDITEEVVSEGNIPYRQLTWSDYPKGIGYTGQFTEEELERFRAVTASTIKVHWNWEKTDSSICQYEYTFVETFAIFVPKNSWVKEESQLASVLNHEQRHFDITESISRDLKDEVLNRKYDCPNGIYDFDKIKEVGQKIYDKFNDEKKKMNNLYDAEYSESGEFSKRTQADWNLKIDCMLKNNGPSDYCLGLVDETYGQIQSMSPNLKSPKHQTNESIHPEAVICKVGLELILKKSDGSPACVTPKTAEKLIKRGWANVQ